VSAERRNLPAVVDAAAPVTTPKLQRLICRTSWLKNSVRPSTARSWRAASQSRVRAPRRRIRRQRDRDRTEPLLPSGSHGGRHSTLTRWDTPESQVRNGLFAGGSRIRTLRPSPKRRAGNVEPGLLENWISVGGGPPVRIRLLPPDNLSIPRNLWPCRQDAVGGTSEVDNEVERVYRVRHPAAA
jgi:hypothetical protein